MPRGWPRETGGRTMQRKPLVCFDTNLTGVRGVRRFWGTLCEMAKQPLYLTPTASSETLRRVRLEVQRETEKALNARRKKGETLNAVYIRRVATATGNAARDALKDMLTQQGSAYLRTARPDAEILALELEIDDSIPEDAFDRTNDNSVRDRKIVVEAAARGYDILASNNVNSMRRGILEQWAQTTGASMGLNFEILTPDDTERRMRRERQEQLEWVGGAAVRACVGNAQNAGEIATELPRMMEDWGVRGMVQIEATVAAILEDREKREEVIQYATLHGPSRACRQEWEIERMQSTAEGEVVREMHRAGRGPGY